MMTVFKRNMRRTNCTSWSTFHRLGVKEGLNSSWRIERERYVIRLLQQRTAFTSMIAIALNSEKTVSTD